MVLLIPLIFYTINGIFRTNNIYTKYLLQYAIQFFLWNERADFSIECIKLNCENSGARYFILKFFLSQLRNMAAFKIAQNCDGKNVAQYKRLCEIMRARRSYIEPPV